MLTEEQRTKYLASPNRCPFCRSDELTLGKVTADINRAMQSISCRQCKRRWTNVYTLTQVAEDDWDDHERIQIPASISGRVEGKVIYQEVEGGVSKASA